MDCAPVAGVFNVSISASTGRGLPYWRARGQHPLGHYDDEITAAVIVQHGDLEYAEDFVCYAYEALAMAFPEANQTAWPFAKHTLLLAPQFWAKDQQGLEEHVWDLEHHHSDLYWHTAEAWMDGDASAGFSPKELKPDLDDADDLSYAYREAALTAKAGPLLNVSSLTVYDELLAALGDTSTYPNLQKVILVGFSAGGQLLQRYALGGVQQSKLADAGVDVRFFVLSPSSYAYLDNRRPKLAPMTDISCAFCEQSNVVTMDYSFSEPDTECPGWDLWKYGLTKLNEYMYDEHGSDLTPMKEAYCALTVTYGVGELDIYNDELNVTIGCGADYPYDNGIDHSCQADLQGYCRMERTVAYAKYVNWYCEHELGVDASGHKLLLVPDFGHDPCGLLQSEALRYGWREFLEPSDDDDDDDAASPPDDDGRRADGHDDDAGRRNDPDGPP